MDRIGNREIVYRGTFIVPEGEEIWFDANIAGWSLKVNVVFDNTGEKRSVSIIPIEGGLRLNLVKWDNSLGTVMINPGRIGTHNDGRKLTFMLTNYLIGKTNKFDIQLMLGAE